MDPTGAMWLSVDPMWEKSAGMSPYNYCMGNPVKVVDPDGSELRDIFKGAVAAINDNIMLGVGNYRGRMGQQAVDTSDYNLGLTIGDCLSVLIGSGEIGTGTGMMALGSAVVAVSVSGGVTAPVAVAGAGEVVAGAALTKHGYYMAAQGLSNIANKKGHLDESSNTSGNKKTYSNRRPSYKKGQVDQVWENAKNSKGEVKDPNTGDLLHWDKSKSRNGQWDMGHTKTNKYSQKHKDYMDGKITKDEF